MGICSLEEAVAAQVAKNDRKLADIRGDEPSHLHLILWDIFVEAATTWPKREAIVSLWKCPETSSRSTQQHDGSATMTNRRWTYSQLLEGAERLAGFLERSGCKSGMQLAAVLWNSVEWALFFWASAKLGMSFVPIDPNIVEEARAIICSIRPDVVVVQDSDEAFGLNLSEADLENAPVRIHCSGQALDGWIRLCEVSSTMGTREIFPTDGVTAEEHKFGEVRTNTERVALVVFTSGTTGNPKGCQHTDRNLISQTHDFDPDPSVTHRWLVHTPVSHIFAVNNALRAWRYGGVVVFPSRSFDVDSTLKALVEERCSVMSATPTLVKALLAHPSFPGPEKLNLHLVTIGGTAIGPEDIRHCRQSLGADHAIQVYGMSEGAPLVTFTRSDPSLVGGYNPGVGKVLPGAAVRICRPGSREILNRSEVGELHISGESVIKNYLSGDSEDGLYSDGIGTWLATGDQGWIDEDGIVYILGRYKDLIIRGGENIYPMRIESKLGEIPGLQSQIVGVPDAIAGQVPVAIVKLPGEITKVEVAEKARQMGLRYALDAVYTLAELGFEKFPVTSIGKVKKELLRQAVTKLRKASQCCMAKSTTSGWHMQSASKPLIDQLLDVWQQLTGSRPSKDDSIMYLGDSITVLRYCEHVLRTCGKRLYLQDFIENDTVAKQAHILMTRDQQQANFDAASKSIPSGGFSGLGVKRSAQEISSWGNGTNLARSPETTVAVDDPLIWHSAQEAVTRVGLEETDIEDVLTIRESLHRTVVGQRPQSFQNRMVFCIRDIGGQQIRHGLEKSLASRPLMRTMVFRVTGKTPFHLILPASQLVLRHLIHDVEVETEEEAMEISKADSPQGRFAPFMFQGHLIKIRGGEQYYLTMTFNHSVTDVMSLTQWHRELDRLILDPDTKIPGLTPYKLFSDLFNQYKDSEPAQKSVQFHVKRLRGISRFERALWPPQRAPGWMISNDEGYPGVEQRLEARENIWEGKWESRAAEFQYPRCCRAVWLPGLARLKEKHDVHASLLAKGAIVIFNVLQTGSSHALFNVWESGRSWPFVPDWMERLLPPAMSIDGPTAEWILNMIEVAKDETVADFFRRMASEQEQIRRYQHVPWGQVVHGLRDEGHIAVDASYRQSFVWDVSMGMSASRSQRIDFTALEPKARYGWPDGGVFWNAFSIDKDNIYFIASWDTAQMNDVEIDGHCDSLAEVIRKLADEENWERTVGQVFGG
ncbi:Fc.00g044290.m01.CDS01 [Cosmosporella sp. VM-42]